jgi:hypothetical protein
MVAERPKVGYWHAYVDERGISRQKRRVMTAFEQESMGGAAAQWNDRLGHFPAGIMISVLPPGWIGDWHENPKPQWIVPLSGHWFVETMDGQRVEMGPGDISFGEDQNCRPDVEGRQGHRSGTIGSDPAVLMVVQLDVPPTVDEAQRWP